MSSDRISSYEAFIFDCDGVLLDSNDLKIQAFRRVLELNGFRPEVIAAGSDWQSRSFGTSRYRLFAELLSGRFGPPPPVTLERLLADFGTECAEGYLAVPETAAIRSVLPILAARARLYVVSGSDELELREVFRRRDLTHYFIDIFGSPRSKIENVERAMQDYLAFAGQKPAKVLFVGDAIADLEAANATGCHFAFMEQYSTVRRMMFDRAQVEGFRVIRDIGELFAHGTPAFQAGCTGTTEGNK
jgi:phosphoglycolate phosphatase-like HAD superfamily hydrolase